MSTTVSIIIGIAAILIGTMLIIYYAPDADSAGVQLALSFTGFIVIAMGAMLLGFGIYGKDHAKDVLTGYTFTYTDKEDGESETLSLFIRETNSFDSDGSFGVSYKTSHLEDNEDNIIRIEVYPDNSCVITHNDGTESYGSNCTVIKTANTKTGLPGNWLKKWLAYYM